jgi:hypothetical protein
MSVSTFHRPTEATAVAQQRLERPSAIGSPAAPPVAHCRPGRRFKPATIGFCLGGLALGAGGCILGALMPYSHPVAVTISVLFWGTYLGCLGASVGALLGWCADRAPSPPSQESYAARTRVSTTDQLPRVPDAAGNEEASCLHEAAHHCSG